MRIEFLMLYRRICFVRNYRLITDKIISKNCIKYRRFCYNYYGYISPIYL